MKEQIVDEKKTENKPEITQVVVMPSGTTPLILGLLGLFGGFIPVVNYITGILSLVAIFTGISQRKKLKDAGLPSGKATAGIILGIIAVLITVITIAIAGWLIGSLFDSSIPARARNSITALERDGGRTGNTGVLRELPEAPESDFRVVLNQSGNGVVITEYIGSATEVRIPAIIQGLPVVTIGGQSFSAGSAVVLMSGRRPEFRRSDRQPQITRLEIPSSVTTIEGYAFFMQSIETINLPENIIDIGALAFAGLSNLKSIVIPNSIINFGDGIFERCTALSSVSLPDGLPYIPNYMFSGCTSLEHIEIPYSVYAIGQGAFAGTGISSITFNGTNLFYIGYNAFQGNNFTEFVIPEGVRVIARDAFSSSRSLTTVTLPTTITDIFDGAFQSCPLLTTVIVPDTVESITFSQGFRSYPAILAPVMGTEYVGGRRSAFNRDNLNIASQVALRRVGY